MTETLQKTENVAENIANKKLQLLEQVSAFELRDQLQIKDMRISKLKEKNAKLIELLKEIRGKIKTVYDMDLNQFITSAAFTDDFVKKIDEVLK